MRLTSGTSFVSLQLDAAEPTCSRNHGKVRTGTDRALSELLPTLATQGGSNRAGFSYFTTGVVQRA